MDLADALPDDPGTLKAMAERARTERLEIFSLSAPYPPRTTALLKPIPFILKHSPHA